MKRKVSLLLLLAMLSPLAYCQVEKAKPEWAINPIHAEGKTSKLVTISEYGRTKESTKTRAFRTLEDQGKKLNEGYRIIEEYWEYTSDWAYGYFLVQISNELKCTNWEHVEMNTTKYPFSARCFVPGMAQIYKGSNVKGGLIIGGEVLGVAGIVTCFSMKGQNERWAQESKKVNDIQYYTDRADMWQNIGYGAIAFTAAIYVYNVIDGAIAPGKKHIQIGSKSYNYALAPMVTTRGDLGLAMRVNF